MDGNAQAPHQLTWIEVGAVLEAEEETDRHPDERSLFLAACALLLRVEEPEFGCTQLFGGQGRGVPKCGFRFGMKSGIEQVGIGAELGCSSLFGRIPGQRNGASRTPKGLPTTQFVNPLMFLAGDLSVAVAAQWRAVGWLERELRVIGNR